MGCGMESICLLDNGVDGRILHCILLILSVTARGTPLTADGNIKRYLPVFWALRTHQLGLMVAGIVLEVEILDCLELTPRYSPLRFSIFPPFYFIFFTPLRHFHPFSFSFASLLFFFAFCSRFLKHWNLVYSSFFLSLSLSLSLSLPLQYSSSSEVSWEFDCFPAI